MGKGHFKGEVSSQSSKYLRKNKPASICSLAGVDGEGREVMRFLAREGARVCLPGGGAYTLEVARAALA